MLWHLEVLLMLEGLPPPRASQCLEIELTCKHVFHMQSIHMRPYAN